MNHDALFKKLLKTPSMLQAFLEAFLPEAARFVDFGVLDFIDKEHTTIYGRPRTGDLVIRTRFRGEPAEFLIHLEHQAQRDSGLAQRMLEYFALDWRDSKLPVYPIAVLSDEEVALDASLPLTVDFPNKRVLQFDFDVIDLPRMKAESYVKMPNPAALALSARMNFSNRLTLMRSFVSTLAQTSLVEAVLDMVIEFFFTYQPLSAQEALQLPDEIAKVQSIEIREQIMQFTNPWIEAGKQQGLQEGKEEGRLEGRLEGRQEGEVELVLRQLNRRFGILSDSPGCA